MWNEYFTILHSCADKNRHHWGVWDCGDVFALLPAVQFIQLNSLSIFCASGRLFLITIQSCFWLVQSITSFYFKFTRYQRGNMQGHASTCPFTFRCPTTSKTQFFPPWVEVGSPVFECVDVLLPPAVLLARWLCTASLLNLTGKALNTAPAHYSMAQQRLLINEHTSTHPYLCKNICLTARFLLTPLSDTNSVPILLKWSYFPWQCPVSTKERALVSVRSIMALLSDVGDHMSTDYHLSIPTPTLN